MKNKILINKDSRLIAAMSLVLFFVSLLSKDLDQAALAQTPWTFSTIAGQVAQIGNNDGQGTNASFHLPSGITIDNSSNIYVADDNNNVIRKITPSGSVSTLAGTFASPVLVKADS